MYHFPPHIFKHLDLCSGVSEGFLSRLRSYCVVFAFASEVTSFLFYKWICQTNNLSLRIIRVEFAQ